MGGVLHNSWVVWNRLELSFCAGWILSAGGGGSWKFSAGMGGCGGVTLLQLWSRDLLVGASEKLPVKADSVVPQSLPRSLNIDDL